MQKKIEKAKTNHNQGKDKHTTYLTHFFELERQKTRFGSRPQKGREHLEMSREE